VSLSAFRLPIRDNGHLTGGGGTRPSGREALVAEGLPLTKESAFCGPVRLGSEGERVCGRCSNRLASDVGPSVSQIWATRPIAVVRMHATMDCGRDLRAPKAQRAGRGR
jgi:hypothetical protein